MAIRNRSKARPVVAEAATGRLHGDDREEATAAFSASALVWNHGIEMWKERHAAKILFTGGLTHGGTVPEALVARRMAESEGIPSAAILTETLSTKTWENILEAERLMRAHDLHNAIIVSDPCHLFRAKIMAEDAGMDAVTSPTPYSAFQTWNTELPFLMNEVRLSHSHWFRGVLGKR